MQSVLKEFGLLDKPKEKTLLTKLYEPVKKDKGVNMPKFQYPTAGLVAQADLLFMPDDKGYKYLLVVVDNGSRLIDAEPIKSKDSKAMVNAFQMIFSRGIVKQPSKKLEVDAGSEFKSGVAKYFENAGVKVRIAETGRHRMQALVEKANQNLGTILHKRMSAQEILTGSISKEWVHDVPKLVKALNTYIKKREAKRKKSFPLSAEIKGEPVCKDGSCETLQIGDHVRVALEFPIDVATGAKLHGRFRSSDIRFNPKVRVIKELLLTPNQPPMYLLDGNVSDKKITPVAYTKAQLQLVGKNEKLPNVNVIRGKPKQWIAEKLIDKKKIKNKIHYLVHWFGFTSANDTWEPASTLKKEVPALVKEYEDNH